MSKPTTEETTEETIMETTEGTTQVDLASIRPEWHKNPRWNVPFCSFVSCPSYVCTDSDWDGERFVDIEYTCKVLERMNDVPASCDECALCMPAIALGLCRPGMKPGLRARLRDWCSKFGAALRPGLRADTFGEGMREAKRQVQMILDKG